MAVMSFLIEDQSLNKDKCIKMALVHDMAESIVGDITPANGKLLWAIDNNDFAGISKEEKHKREQQAMESIREKLDDAIGFKTFGHDIFIKFIGKEIFFLWAEYEEGKTPEARWVKEVDRLEMLVQALEYELGNPLRNFHSNEKSQNRERI